MVFFDSRNHHFKRPFGAVPQGDIIYITLRVNTGIACTAPVLFWQRDGRAALPVPMRPAGRDGSDDIFTAGIPCVETGLFFYWFDLWTDYQKLYRDEDGRAFISREADGPKWAQLVYDAAFTTPEDVHGAVMYQIFPDRFFEGRPHEKLAFSERIYRPDKQNPPYFWPSENGQGGLTQDYYGGDFLGIEKRLPYLQALGVSWLYLNPICEAHSNHRYNIANYMNADPDLGTNEDFAHLAAAAKKIGINIIIDGVFSHTGSDSIYFNKEGRYPEQGAWQSPNSVYRSWYQFHGDGSYNTWWGFETLPACDKGNPEFRRFITGEGGVIDHWMRLGASGFRLDVADELPDDFIAEIRAAVKRHGEDKLLIGEVWEDAALKEAYGVRRRYFWGNGLDGVMNYPFRTAIIDYLRGFDSAGFARTVMDICEHYPKEALAACTCHMSTHDTQRAITALAGEEPGGRGRAWQSVHRLSGDEMLLGIKRLRLAFALQFTLPGVPCVYYGDEIAMQGYADPFNRAYFDWNSGEETLTSAMRELAGLRRRCAAFRTGDMRILEASNILVFSRTDGKSTAAVAVNGTPRPAAARLLGEEVYVPAFDYAVRTV